jgi:exosome complex RNA-binding protein Csl4
MELKKYKVIHNSNYYNIGDIVKAKLDYSGTDIRIYDNGNRYARSLPIE